MKKTTYVLSLLAFGIGLNFTGMGGCGSSSSSTTTPTETSASLTSEEQQTALDLVSADQERSRALEAALTQGLAALSVRNVKNQITSIEFECPVAGNITFDLAELDADSFDFNFNACQVLLEPEEDLGTGFVNYTFDGTSSYELQSETVSVITQDLTVTRDPQDEGEATTSCELTGTITSTSSSSATTSVYDLLGDCTNGAATTTGTLTATSSGTGDAFTYLVDGTLVSTFIVSGRSVVCNYVDFDVGTATCADYADACGLDDAIVCN